MELSIPPIKAQHCLLDSALGGGGSPQLPTRFRCSTTDVAVDADVDSESFRPSRVLSGTLSHSLFSLSRRWRCRLGDKTNNGGEYETTRGGQHRGSQSATEGISSEGDQRMFHAVVCGGDTPDFISYSRGMSPLTFPENKLYRLLGCYWILFLDINKRKEALFHTIWRHLFSVGGPFGRKSFPIFSAL